MSVTMEDGIKRWTAKRKSAPVVEIIQGKTTVAASGPWHEDTRRYIRISGIT